MKKLFVGYVKNGTGTDVFTKVDRIKIAKIDNKNHVIIYYVNKQETDIIPLAEISDMMFIKINSDTDIEELFRYKK